MMEQVKAVHKSPRLQEVHKTVKPNYQLSEDSEEPFNVFNESQQLV
jgi:hypothetical protein